MARTMKRDMHDVVSLPVQSPAGTSKPVESIESVVARRAFELYCERGRHDGHDVEDWLYAEHEVRGGTASADSFGRIP